MKEQRFLFNGNEGHYSGDINTLSEVPSLVQDAAQLAKTLQISVEVIIETHGEPISQSVSEDVPHDIVEEGAYRVPLLGEVLDISDIREIDGEVRIPAEKYNPRRRKNDKGKTLASRADIFIKTDSKGTDSGMPFIA